MDGLGRRGTRRPRPPRPLRPRPESRRWPLVRNHRTPNPIRTAAAYGPRTRAAIDAPHLRTDRWWLAPAVTAAGLLAFIVYSTWRAFANADYYAAPYVSPFYSPCLAENCEPMRARPQLRSSSAAGGACPPRCIILIFPLGFRLTCYYYRKAYYRGFWASPPACAVAEPHKKYTGETRFPLILQNIHRYFFYAAIAGRRDPHLRHRARLPRRALRVGPHGPRHPRLPGQHRADLGVHPLLPLLPAHRRRQAQALLQASRALPAVAVVGKLNARHMLLAWASLVSVALADFYVYLVASGAFDDPRFF